MPSENNIRLCKDCVHFRKPLYLQVNPSDKPIDESDYVWALCELTEKQNPVSGTQSSTTCFVERNNYSSGGCGPSGYNFKAKE